MPIDAIGRKKRAVKAANCSAKIRKAATEERDKNIRLAFLYLTMSGNQTKTDMIKAIAFLDAQQAGNSNLRKGESILRKLADRTGLTRQRIHQIVKKIHKNK